ncbi:MAG: NPXTG-anchored protein [Oscillospiraceae bacterium]|nr:NPXTG-anchored protein [Oscillospiraceae bacterium]
MKKTRIFAALAATAVAATALTAAVSAYNFNDFDLGISWSNNAIIPAEEFASLTADSTITFTFETDSFEKEYWCFKPTVALPEEQGGWTWILEYAEASDGDYSALINGGGDAFEAAEKTSVSFKVPAGAVDPLKEYGMAVLGHSVILKEMTISAGTPAGGSAGGDKGSPETGVEGVAVVAGVALLASAAVVISRKRK